MKRSFLLCCCVVAVAVSGPAEGLQKQPANENQDPGNCLETEQGRRNAAQGALVGGLFGALLGDQVDSNNDNRTTLGAIVGATMGGAIGCETGERQAEFESSETQYNSYIGQLEIEANQLELETAELEQDQRRLNYEIEVAERERASRSSRYFEAVRAIDARRSEARDRMRIVDGNLQSVRNQIRERSRANAPRAELALLRRHERALSNARNILAELANAPRV
ncbi:glycine zipper domain-containing protein [Maricaulis salignorans]|uniref:Glycine zipper 2TM domain-containing protein n=1 Tax=Maricaulis salignorans TaxID=144026 RepID=A0A1G9RQI6_9PROT|nr:YMGG-like glycine zipper-containing protein [Maricaulis salignorans]SDM25217.1 Glycine zipper 2TM domain-containing protein [Maricaulis salignorans]